ncbi:protein serine/threonine phosphatase 2C [Piromyces finnis]|uniref:Protein serine/threonine phosphatase 2C n=1 Tax=Piromyces finnis TaxID=1754191 RepID=A0A1Y1VPW0_9FUNG|nr:protein serine/threonine phosphatase 2C [Piromyces finnis]|eukprot:ORX60911.1 protein serine/threonine phosphatase 2C [Piromyces finnis]
MKKRNSSVTSTTKTKNEVLSTFFLKQLEINYKEEIKELNASNCKTLNEYDSKFLSDRSCLESNGLIRGSSTDFFTSISTSLENKENSSESKNFVLDFTNNYISRNMLFSIFKTIEENCCSTALILKNVGLLETVYEDELIHYTPTDIIGSLLKLLRLDILTALDLSDNNIGNEFIHSLFIRGIAFTTNLKQLKLSNTGISNMVVTYDMLGTLGAFELPFYLKSNKMDELIDYNLKMELNNDNKLLLNEVRTNSAIHSDDIVKTSKINYSLHDIDISGNHWNTEPFKILENFPNIIPRTINYKLLTTIQSEKISYHIDRNSFISSIVDVLISSCSVRRNSNTKQKKLMTLIKKKSTNWAFGYSFYNSIKKDKNYCNYYIHLNFRGKEDEFIVVYFKGVNDSKYIEYCQEWLPKLLEQEYNHWDSIYVLYEIVFDKLNKKLKDMAINEGVTVLILHICEYKMYIINLGDSTAILKTSESKIPIRLSRQHLTSNPYEASRIEKRNISSEMFDECHSITRMIGYSKYSNILSTKPEILIRKINFENDQYIIISDRDVWKVLSMDDVDRIYNEVINQMKDETLVSSNWPDVVAKRLLYLVKNKYKVKDEISIIVLILYKKDMPKCKKKIEDISNISPMIPKDKAISFQNIIGMIGLGKNEKNLELDSQSSIEKFSLDKVNNNSYTETTKLNNSDYEISMVNHGKRMSLDIDYIPSKSNKGYSNQIILSPNHQILMNEELEGSDLLIDNDKRISMKNSSFKNYEIPLYKNNVSNEFITEMECFLNKNNSNELNTVNWFKNETRNSNRYTRMGNNLSKENGQPFSDAKYCSNYELENLGVLDEEKNGTASSPYRNIYSSSSLNSDYMTTSEGKGKKK